MNRLTLRLAAGAALAIVLLWLRAYPSAARVQAVVPQESAAADARLEDAYRLSNLGVAQLEQYDYDGAVASFSKALDIAPSLQLARVNLSIALLHADKLPEAEKAAEQACWCSRWRS